MGAQGEVKVNAKTIGPLVREFRTQRGLTQKQLAEYTGLTRSKVAQIEIGRTAPSGKILSKISDVLEIGSLLTRQRPADGEAEGRIEDLVADFRLLARRNFDQAQRFLRTARQAEEAIEGGNEFMLDVAEERLEEVRLLFSGAAVGTIDLRGFSPVEVWGKLLKQARKKILATSCLKPTVWWTSSIGKWYQELNISKKEQSVEIERIFVFESPDECKQGAQTISEQVQARIRVWIGYNLPPGLASDFFIIDDYYVGWLNIRDREVVESTRFSTNRFELERAHRIFDSMKLSCEEITDNDHLERFLNC